MNNYSPNKEIEEIRNRINDFKIVVDSFSKRNSVEIRRNLKTASSCINRKPNPTEQRKISQIHTVNNQKSMVNSTKIQNKQLGVGFCSKTEINLKRTPCITSKSSEKEKSYDMEPNITIMDTPSPILRKSKQIYSSPIQTPKVSFKRSNYSHSSSDSDVEIDMEKIRRRVQLRKGNISKSCENTIQHSSKAIEEEYKSLFKDTLASLKSPVPLISHHSISFSSFFESDDTSLDEDIDESIIFNDESGDFEQKIKDLKRSLIEEEDD